MKKLGMNVLLAVGQGSTRDSQLLVMSWMKGPKSQKPVALIGKGVCFDTGGISLKPAGGMEDMKWDMGGAGAVTGAMRLIAGRKARANVVGICAVVENMPDGNAQRPGDVVKSMSGQTVEVVNTDAEGRLILCDAMWYAQEKFKPQAMVEPGQGNRAQGRHGLRCPPARQAGRRQLRALTQAMATEVNFYHLTKSSLDDALPRLLQKTLQAGERAVVMVGSPERVDALDTHLWPYDPNGFLPHRSARAAHPHTHPVGSA